MYRLAIRTLSDRGTAYSISVPISWVRQNKLKKGDAIGVFLDADERLVLIPEVKKNGH